MKKIESVLRSFVAQERMYNLALLNTELIVHKMDFTDIIDLFTAAKTRKRLSITAIRYLPIFPRPPSLLYSVHRTQRRGWLLGLDLVTMSVIDLRDRHWLPVQHRITYKICLLVDSTWSTVSPPQPVSVTVDDFGSQAANATSSREHDSNLASAASPLLVRQLGTAFHHQFKN